MDSLKFYSGDKWAKPKIITPISSINKKTRRGKSKIKTHRHECSRTKFTTNEGHSSRNLYSNDQYK